MLEDGSTLLSQRGMLRGLRGETASHERGDLGQYLARLPEKYSAIASATNLEFMLPDGGVAIGRPARDFVAMCRAYAEMFSEGSIHKARIPLARNAIAILSMLAGRGLDEMIYEATGYRPVAAPAPAPTLDTAALASALATAIATAVAPLHQRLSALETQTAKLTTEPSLGRAQARRYILGPLLRAARMKAATVGKVDNAAAVASIRQSLENQLREDLDFPRRRGHAWSNFPAARLGDACLKVARLTGDELSFARLAAKAEQLVLPLKGRDKPN